MQNLPDFLKIEELQEVKFVLSVVEIRNVNILIQEYDAKIIALSRNVDDFGNVEVTYHLGLFYTPEAEVQARLLRWN